jgi:hypothetical protein
MNRNTAVLLLSSILLLPVTSFAAFSSNDAGTTGAPFLKLSAGARSAGLGEATVARYYGANTLFYNPAVLGDISSGEVSLTHGMWFEGVSVENVAAVLPTRFGGLGFGGTILRVDSLQQYDESGNEVSGSIAPSDMSFLVGYGTKIGSLSCGVNAKYISSKLADITATAFAIDAGAILPLSEKLSMGGAITNLGTPIKYISESNPLPMAIKLGLAYVSGPLNLEADLNAPYDNDPGIALGGEYMLEMGKDVIFVPRAG